MRANPIVTFLLWTITSCRYSLGFTLISHAHKRVQKSLTEHRLIPSGESSHDEYETLESLGDTLTQLCEKLQEEENISTETAQLSLLYTRIANLSLNRTRVGTSSILNGGRGLYASCDCRKGDLLTCYPGDALVIIPDSDKEDWTILWGDHVEEEHAIDKLMGYILHAVQDEYGVVGLPSLDQDPAYAGHFANDGASEPPVSTEALAPYVIESSERANAMHKDWMSSHMVTVATRDIKEGEEIFVTYGPEYWMEQPMFGTGDETSNSSKQPPSSGRGFG